MTMTLRSERSALPAVADDLQPSTSMTLFLADTLLPLMAGIWPGSANQLDGNARGVAMAWGAVLKGFSARQIREAVMRMAEDAERQFAPRPAEVRAEIIKAQPVMAEQSAAVAVSLRACEMMAEARVYVREQRVSDAALQRELAMVLAEKSRQGVTVTGRVM